MLGPVELVFVIFGLSYPLKQMIFKLVLYVDMLVEVVGKKMDVKFVGG